MKLLVILEQRFEKTPDGSVWTKSTFHRAFWQRYMCAFDEICIIARTKRVSAPFPGSKRADGSAVFFADIPYYKGPLHFLFRFYSVTDAVWRAYQPDAAIILRMGTLLGILLYPIIRRNNHPYAVELVGDPYDVFAPGVVRTPLRPFLRFLFAKAQKKICAEALGVAYVTDYTLQRRYPCNRLQAGISDVSLDGNIDILPTPPMINFSSIDLPEEAYGGYRNFPPDGNMVSIIFVGSLEQLYKGPDILIKAVAKCISNGLSLKLTIVGGGKYQNKLKKLSRLLRISDRVCFAGTIPAGQEIIRYLDSSDLFILPSRTEGLPRALIEAMARALPCIATRVGGIPELLASEDLVEPSNSEALAAKIAEVLFDTNRMSRMSHRNLERSRAFHADILTRRRILFYSQVSSATNDWLTRNPSK
jgi:L-malate glycosyltransferase